MDDALLVRRFERLRDLLRDGQRLVNRDRPARNALRQILALDELHHDRAHTATLFEAVDVRDVRVIDGRQRLRFAIEPREPVGVARERIGQDLQRNIAIELRISRAEHLAHPANTDARDDFVDAEARARSQSQLSARLHQRRPVAHQGERSGCGVIRDDDHEALSVARDIVEVARQAIRRT